MNNITELWFLLYGGTSADGMGPGVYIGRTTNVAEARAHLKQCKEKSPYSTGYVQIIGDKGGNTARWTDDFDAMVKRLSGKGRE